MFGNWYFGSYQVVKFLRLMRLMRMHLGFTRAGLHVCGFCAGPGQARTLAGAVFRREGRGLSERFWCV